MSWGCLCQIPILVLTAVAAPLATQGQLPLCTQGRRILDAKGQPFQLKCVNWYGASGERFVVLGLHERNLSDMVSTIHAMGFNCVRLPFSLELYFKDPPVRVEVVRGDPLLSATTNLTGLQAFDATVAALTMAGLAVIIDNHSSKAHWCCESGAPDGAWFTPEYPESLWIEALAGMARRYRSNRHVVAIELRNEVRDSPDAEVVWGDTDTGHKAHADWAAAAERAGNEVLRENPDVLVLVTGLCYGQDLRGLHERPLRLDVSGRLVWTSHSYFWYFWWHDQVSAKSWYEIAATSGALAVFALVAALALFNTGNTVTLRGTLIALVSFCGLLGTLLLKVAQMILSIATDESCADLGRRSSKGSYCAGVVLLSFAGAMTLCLLLDAACRYRRAKAATLPDPVPEPTGGWLSVAPPNQMVRACIASCGETLALPKCVPCPKQLASRARCGFMIPLLVMLAAGLVALCIFAVLAQTQWLVANYIDHLWGFADDEGHLYTAPIFLGEFGTDYRSDFWLALVSYLQEQQLSFAYWPLNGQRWAQWHGGLVDETYGLLATDWRSIRHEWRLQDIDL